MVLKGVDWEWLEGRPVEKGRLVEGDVAAGY